MFVFVWALIYHPTLTADNSKKCTSNVSGYPEGLICLKTMAKGKTAEGIQLNVSEVICCIYTKPSSVDISTALPTKI
jgi:hypothetical protein